MEFEWDPAKNDLNIVKHGIDFEDAIEGEKKRQSQERGQAKREREERKGK